MRQISDARAAKEEHQIEIRRLRGEPLRRPDADQAVRAAGDGVPLERDRPGDLREGEREHREVHAGEAHAEPAEDERAREREQGRRDERELHRQGEAQERAPQPYLRRERIRGMTERRLPQAPS